MSIQCVISKRGLEGKVAALVAVWRLRTKGKANIKNGSGEKRGGQKERPMRRELSSGVQGSHRPRAATLSGLPGDGGMSNNPIPEGATDPGLSALRSFEVR